MGHEASAEAETGTGQRVSEKESGGKRMEDTTRLTGCTAVTASGLEAALPVLALLPTCRDCRRTFVPEARSGPLAKIWSWIWGVTTTFTTCSGGGGCADGGGVSGAVGCCAGVRIDGGSADVGAAERALGQRTGHRGEGDASGPLLNDLRLLLIHKDADAAASDERGFIGKFGLCHGCIYFIFFGFYFGFWFVFCGVEVLVWLDIIW